MIRSNSPVALSASSHRFRLVAFLVLQFFLACPLRAQTEGTVAALGPLLAAEDARKFDAAVLGRGLVSPDSLVRRTAAFAAGRIRDPRGVPLLLPLLLDPDSTVQSAAAFALGLVEDSSAVPRMIRRFNDPAPLSLDAADELLTALAKTGGPEAGRFFGDLIAGSVLRDRADWRFLVQRAVLESWRLGKNAPVTRILPLTEDSLTGIRWYSLYTLGRLRVPAAGDRMVTALRDQSAYIRATAARSLTKAFADTANLKSESVQDLLIRTLIDRDPGVRIQAIRSLGTFHSAAASGSLLPLLEDPVPNVAVQAAAALGELRGQGGAELARIARGRRSFGLRREALLSLARVDTAAFMGIEKDWSTSPDWRERATAAEAWVRIAPGAILTRRQFLADADPRVVAAALQAWGEQVEGPDSAFVSTARPLLGHRDAAVRSVAADAVARAASLGDLPVLTAAFSRSTRDSFPEGAISALGAILAISNSSEAAARQVKQSFLAVTPRPENYLLRRWAEEQWPAAAERWGASTPIATGRTGEDYRDLARKFLVGTGPDSRPHVIVEIDQLGPLEIELFGPEAPLTVANFLRLVDRRFFDGQRWHRVVPNFVVQGGDPRGDGWGGPASAIRDEINPRRYGTNTIGMALSGPDTGGSQWFITLSPQPHLDGAYTVFGKVVDGIPALNRVTQGDLIRTIHR